MIKNTRKAVLPLSLAFLVGGCEPSENVENREAVEVSQEDLVFERQTSMLEAMRNGWVGVSKAENYSVATILPIDYNYNWKHSEDIDGVWVGIEGRIGASNEFGNSLEIWNYTPYHLRELVGDNIPKGYSIVTMGGFEKPTGEETRQMLNAFEKYVTNRGEELELGLTSGEMSTLINAVEGLNGGRE